MIIALKKIMDEKKITVPELVEKTGLTKNMIWAYQSGRNNPDPETLCALADILDVSLDMLIRGKEKDRPFGRSKEDLMKMFSGMSEEEHLWLIALLQASLADKRFQAHLRQEHPEEP